MAKKEEVKGHLRGRFKKGIDKAVEKYVASIPFDWRLYKQDIAGSIAHAQMLAKHGLITEKDAELIVSGLVAIRDEIEQGKLEFKPELEDIHMSIESGRSEKIGDGACKVQN